MDKPNMSLNAMKQLVVEQPLNGNGNGVKVFDIPEESRGKNHLASVDNSSKTLYSRKRKATQPASMAPETNAGDSTGFASFDDSNASTSNEDNLAMADQFANGYDGDDASMMAFAHPMVNPLDDTDDSNDIEWTR